MNIPLPAAPWTVVEADLTMRKEVFARLMFMKPAQYVYTAAAEVFPNPNDKARQNEASTYWMNDPIVLRVLAELQRERDASDKRDDLPGKEGVALRLMALANNPTIGAADRLKALAQYTALMGYDPPKTGDVTNNFNGPVNNRRVYVLPKQLSAEEWERKHDPAVKQIEGTVNARSE